MRVILRCGRSSIGNAFVGPERRTLDHLAFAIGHDDYELQKPHQADIMSSQQLIRWAGLAAMLAGALRTAASFWPSAEPGVTLEILYLVIDILLLFGIFGIYAFQHERIGWFGFVGFLLAVIGTAVIAGPDGTIGLVNMYAAGSLSVGAGMVFLAVGSWTARTLPRWVAILWIVSTVVGILGAVTGRESLFVVTGVTFGVAFVGAGARLWSRHPE